MPESQTQATGFFAKRVIQQARSEGMPLSDVESQMLYWSESDPAFKADPQFAATFARHRSDEEFEAKICGFLKRAYAADVAADPHAREKWGRAFAALQRGDYYVTIMIERSLGYKVKMRRWWPQAWGLRAVPAALVIMCVLGAYVIVVRTLLGNSASNADFRLVTWAVAVVIALAYGAASLAFGRGVVDGFISRAINRLLGN